jgi:phospholipid/cholesterol/gamma-HCH transport system permease protein
MANHASSWSDLAKEKVLRVQDYAILSAQSISNLFHGRRYPADTILQADSIGVGSLPIVVLTAAATGAELALNSASTLEKFGALFQIAPLVSEGMIRELGPVITALMVAGRNTSGMASQLGSMRVTDQIDAMRALGTDPSRKLVTPRVVASVFMLCWLVIIADLVGLFGGALISTMLYRVDWHQYWTSAWQILDFKDLTIGLIKPPLFGFIIATIGCSYGMTTRGGTEGVGRSTTQAVVAACVLIVIADVLVTKLLLTIFGRF